MFTDPARLEKIKKSFSVVDSIYKKLAKDNHFPGLAFGIVVDGKLVHTGNYGYTNIEKKDPCYFVVFVPNCIHEQKFYGDGDLKIAG